MWVFKITIIKTLSAGGLGYPSAAKDNLGFSLDWRELPEKKASRILVLKDVNLMEQSEWPDQFDWITDTMVKIKKAFKKFM